MSYGSTVLADLPILAWPLDETSGTAAADASGNGRTGTYSGGPSLHSASVFAEPAPTFGNPMYVQADNVLLVVAPFTLECLVNRNAFLAGQTANINSLMGDLVSTNNGAALRWDNSTTTIQVYVANGAGGYANISGALGLNTDYHVALVATTTSIELYINGVSVASTATTPAGFNLPYRVARTEDGRYMDGAVAWAAVYDFALSAGQVAAHFGAASGSFGSITTGVDIGATTTGHVVVPPSISTGVLIDALVQGTPSIVVPTYDIPAQGASPHVQEPPVALAAYMPESHGADAPGIGYPEDTQYRSQ